MNLIMQYRYLHGLLVKNTVWLSWKHILKYAAAMALSAEKVADP